jgi:phage terminase large subunit-like protein
VKENPLLTLDQVALLAEQLLRKAAQFPGIRAYKPHEAQEKFHKSTALEKLFIGGNRSGKTTGAVAEDVFWLTGEHPYRTDLPVPPVRGRIVAVDIEDGIKKIVLPELAKWTPQKFLINNSWEDSYDRQSRTLTLNNGSFVELMSFEQDVAKFAGTSRHFVHFDEEPPLEVFNENLMRLVDTNGSYWIAMTPLIEMSWVKSNIYEPWQQGNESIFVLEVETNENPHISQEALDRITRGLTVEERAARTEGKFITHTGLVYAGSFSARNYNEDGNILHDILDAHFREYTKYWNFFTCFDHGYANPAVFLLCCFNGDGNIIVFDEIYQTRMIVKDLAHMYQARIEALGIRPLYVVGDPTIRNTSAITQTSVQTEYMEHGVGIALGNNNVTAGIARLQNRFRMRRVFITSRCVNTLHEIANYRWDRYASSRLDARRNKKETPLKKDDHCLDALRYGVMSRPAYSDEEEVKPFNFLGVPETAQDIDYAAMFHNPGFDEVLGTEW